MKTDCRKIVVAGTHSGVGKTTITLALVASLSRRDMRVSPFKVGPDYLDCTHLARAAAVNCYNLDGWMSQPDYVRSLFARVCQDADVAVIEGVMGLFDGASPVGLEGSTAEIAAWLDAPVLLVIDAHGASRSLAALVHGFASFDQQTRVVGVIANRIGSDQQARNLAQSLEAGDLPPLLGAIPRDGFPALPHRHLGLVSADAHNLSRTVLTALADGCDRWIDMSKLLTVAEKNSGRSIGERARSLHCHTKTNRASSSQLRDTSPPIAASSRSSLHRAGACIDESESSCDSAARPPTPRPVRVGVAWDEAFHFYYPDNLEALESAGCDLVRFSPTNDPTLPAGLSGLYLGGGYPEAFAGPLAKNRTMLASIRAFAADNRPIYAECGGLMYLSNGIVDRDGREHPMLGILQCWTQMLEQRKRLGYVEITLLQDSLLGARGARVRGHEFHYSRLVGDPAQGSGWLRVYELRRPRSQSVVLEGFQRGRILASYVHAHFASQPGAAQCFRDNCTVAA